MIICHLHKDSDTLIDIDVVRPHDLRCASFDPNVGGIQNQNDIMKGLSHIANEYSLFAVVFHGIIILVIGALMYDWRPSNRFFSSLLCVPFSVSVFAWSSSNPFNGGVLRCLPVSSLVWASGIHLNLLYRVKAYQLRSDR